MKPTKDILKKAIASVKSPFTIEVIEFGFTPTNKNQFGISVINVRGGRRILLDYYFTIKTGKLVKCITIENSFSIAQLICIFNFNLIAEVYTYILDITGVCFNVTV